MDTLKIGQIIEGKQNRDSVHMAVAPVTAAHRLAPATHVGFVGEGLVGTDAKEAIGIIDPFLEGAVMKGEMCWLFLYPGSITSLRHDWEHPAFAGDIGVESHSSKWLHDFARTAGISYAELMDGARCFQERGEYLCEGGRWEGFDTPDEFWDHYEAVTGAKAVNRWGFFSCSC